MLGSRVSAICWNHALTCWQLVRGEQYWCIRPALHGCTENFDHRRRAPFGALRKRRRPADHSLCLNMDSTQCEAPKSYYTYKPAANRVRSPRLGLCQLRSQHVSPPSKSSNIRLPRCEKATFNFCDQGRVRMFVSRGSD